MPIDWRDVDTWPRLMASLLVAHDITKASLNYNLIATVFGQGATYDSIESRFRPIRNLAKKILEEASQNGVNLRATPRGRQRAVDTTTLSRINSDEAQPSHSRISEHAGNSSSRKRSSMQQRKVDRKKIKRETKADSMVIEISEDSDPDVDPARRTCRQPYTQAPGCQAANSNMMSAAVKPGMQKESTEAILARSISLNGGNSGEMYLDAGPSRQPWYGNSDSDTSDSTNEDDEEDLPLPPGELRVRQSAVNKEMDILPNELAPSGRDTKLELAATQRTAPPTLRDHSPISSTHDTNEGHPRTLHNNAPNNLEFLPSSKLYREPPTHPSTTTSLSNENEPFLPRRTASKSSPSPVPTRFSSMSAYRPTTADFQPPDDLLPTDWMEGLNLEVDEKGVPIIDHGRGSYGGHARGFADVGAYYESKSASSKSTSGSSSTGLRRSQSFMSPFAERYPGSQLSARSGPQSSKLVANQSTDFNMSSGTSLVRPNRARANASEQINRNKEQMQLAGHMTKPTVNVDSKAQINRSNAPMRLPEIRPDEFYDRNEQSQAQKHNVTSSSKPANSKSNISKAYSGYKPAPKINRQLGYKKDNKAHGAPSFYCPPGI